MGIYLWWYQGNIYIYIYIYVIHCYENKKTIWSITMASLTSCCKHNQEPLILNTLVLYIGYVYICGIYKSNYKAVDTMLFWQWKCDACIFGDANLNATFPKRYICALGPTKHMRAWRVENLSCSRWMWTAHYFYANEIVYISLTFCGQNLLVISVNYHWQVCCG